MQSEPCKSPLKCVKNIKSLHSLLSLKYPTVTFLPFNLHISNYQRFIKTQVVVTFPPISSLTSVNVLVKKSLNNDSNRIQAQEARKYTEEIS